MKTLVDKEIFAKQVEYLYKHLPVALLAMLINASVLLYFLGGEVSRGALWGWFAANFIIFAARLASYRLYRHSPGGYERDRRYFLVFLAGIIASGLLWGSSAFLFLAQSSIAHQVFLIFICGGMAAGAIGSSAVRIELYATYQLLLLLPFIIELFIIEGELYVLLSIMLFLYMGMLMFSAFRFYKTFSSTFRLTAANNNLVTYLEQNKNSIESLNKELLNEVQERVVAQEELQRALEDAKKANRAKDVFLASMSHELRTPLNAILGFSQILMMKKELPESIRPYMEKILLSGQNLLSLVNTILDFSKIEAGKMEFNPEKFVFADLMKEVLVLFETSTSQKHLEIAYEDPCDSELIADYQLLKQVMINLLSNAVKFSRERGEIHIECRIDTPNDCFVVSVRDNGTGINPEALSTLFDPFTQAVSEERERIKGTGLGLAISKQIVENIHKGRIWVKSEAGKGSVFFVEIPMSTREDACKL